MIDSFLLTLAQAAPQGSPASSGPGGLLSTPLIPLAAMVVLFYYLIIRPQQKQQKEHAALVSSVKIGDSVVMSSGIHGMVANVKEKTVVVKVADNVKIEFDKSAVASVAKASSEA